MIRPDPDFPARFSQARERFLAAARARGARLDSFAHPAGPGPDGEPLATDVALFGPADARDVILLQSGTHGVEGYCGSGVQHALLREGGELDAALAAGARVLMLHAINPWGFAWCRRVTQEGVDLNRNFRHFPVPEGGDPDYDEIHDLALPESFPWTAGNAAAIGEFMRRRGAAQWQFAMSHGQWSHPDGLFFCGRAPTWSQRTLREVMRRHVRGAARLFWIDYHTGLGPPGHGEMIYSGLDVAADLDRTRAVWGPAVTSIYDGSSSSARIEGMVATACYEECPDVALATIALEYGTLPFGQVGDALRTDHWVAARAPGDAAMRAMARERMLAAFFVDTDDWKAAVLAQGRTTFSKAVDALGAPA